MDNTSGNITFTPKGLLEHEERIKSDAMAAGYAQGVENTEAVASARINELEKELEEQCRLNGMGGSREAKLIAEKEALQKALDEMTARNKANHDLLDDAQEELAAHDERVRRDTLLGLAEMAQHAGLFTDEQVKSLRSLARKDEGREGKL